MIVILGYVIKVNNDSNDWLHKVELTFPIHQNDNHLDKVLPKQRVLESTYLYKVISSLFAKLFSNRSPIVGIS